MNRRDWFKTFGSASALPLVAQRQGNAVETAIVRLNLRHTWTTTMSSSEFRETLHLSFRSQGTTGRGEGAPIVRYKESAQTAQKAVQSVAEYLKTSDPWKFSKVVGEVFRRIDGEWAAKAAIDIALMDWVGQKLGVPLYRYFGLDARDAPVTTFSIGMDKPDVVRRKILEAEQFPVLKIKVGLDSDEEMMASVRAATKKPLRVDANEGWKSREEAVRKINWLESQGVEFIEQPMPASMIGDIRWVRSKVHIPIIADEACLHPRDIPELATAYDGVNVKIDKCGGMLEAFRMIQIARSLGLKVMLGCMVSSSVAVTAAAHLSPLADYADLDGNLLVSNDPYTGVLVEKGKLILPNRPGLGLLPAKGGG
jgi:L-alanine-DL-glutamate epimerase-like enolase superfamily enzyme